MNLDLQSKYTFVDRKDAKEHGVTISGGGAGTDKRFCTLQIFLEEGEDDWEPDDFCPIAIFFEANNKNNNKISNEQ